MRIRTGICVDRSLWPRTLLLVVIVISLQACGDSPARPWHTVKLTEEYTAGKAGEIQTFDDYRRLEDKLFAELEEKIYAVTGTGPEYELVRFSAGSAADPRQHETNWNRSFELGADPSVGGVLLLHGMSDSPYSLRAVGQTLNEHGYQVLGLRLPGHGTAPSGLKHIRSEDLAAAVRLSMKHLTSKGDGRPIHIIGYSTGAALALGYSLDALEGEVSPVPASLVLISPAIGIHPAAALAKWKNRLASLPGLEGLAWTQILPEFDPFNFNSFTTNAGDVVHRLTRDVARRVSARAQSKANAEFPPTLVLLSTVDATVSTDNVVDRLLVHLPPDRNELVLFDINRFAVKSRLLISDPGPLTDELMTDATLPFAITLVTNENAETDRVAAKRKPPLSQEISETESLNLSWPIDVVSLSHVALPFPPDDPLYGQRPPDNEDVLFLGEMPIQGERGLLKLSGDWLLRLRHNPFYGFLEMRVLEWLGAASAKGSE